MAYRITSGMVSLDLVKPVDFQLARFAEIAGGLLAELILGAVVWVAVVAFGGGVALPPPVLFALFLASMVLVVPTKFVVAYLSVLTCFWTHHYTGVQWAQLAIVGLLSGSLIPISFYPGWLAAAAAWLPFAGLASTPGLIFTGRVDVGEAVRLVVVQAAWAVALWYLARRAFATAVRRLTVHGG
jgi:ABC-2 type transport system permease protein